MPYFSYILPTGILFSLISFQFYIHAKVLCSYSHFFRKNNTYPINCFFHICIYLKERTKICPTYFSLGVKLHYIFPVLFIVTYLTLSIRILLNIFPEIFNKLIPEDFLHLLLLPFPLDWKSLFQPTGSVTECRTDLERGWDE